MTVFVVLWRNPDIDDGGIDSVFSTAELAWGRVESMFPVRPDLTWAVQEMVVDDLIGGITNDFRTI